MSYTDDGVAQPAAVERMATARSRPSLSADSFSAATVNSADRDLEDLSKREEGERQLSIHERTHVRIESFKLLLIT